MNTNTLSKVNRFGKIGTVVMTVLLIIAIIVTLTVGISAVYAATFPNDAVRVTVTNNAEFNINEKSFSSVWRMLSDGFVYGSDEDPSIILKNGGGEVLPPENKEINARLKFFNQSYSTATVRSVGNEKVVDAKSSPVEYRSSDLVIILIFGALLSASVAAALLLLRNLFKVLSRCDSPFCSDFVSKLRIFGCSLLPIAVFASVGETLAIRFMSAGKLAGISVQWGVLVAFAVTMCLVAVFRYGVQLQKESDETL